MVNHYIVLNTKTNQQQRVYNLPRWCKENNLNYTALLSTYIRHLKPNANTFNSTCKGYKVIELKRNDLNELSPMLDKLEGM